MPTNNVNLDKLKATVAEVQKDLSKAKKANKIEGEWNSGPGPQFRATVSFEGGKALLEADQPTGLGGGGTQPGPMIYCLYGSASCYAATFATMAAMEGITLKQLRITAESNLDLSKVFGLSDNPIAEKVKFTLHVESDATADRIKKLEELSKERCPAVYCLTNAIPLETELKIG
ncbi:MAG: OsmC family protein [Deltaproteobacteria bacterium]|nr:OsmC family protein [Deltaproteobacteria bacterium]